MATAPTRDLSALRARRWWGTRRPVRSLARAAAFVEDLGFALLFPGRGVELPSLYGAATDLGMEWAVVGWGPVAERVWGWKDELPRRGLAWYGKFLRGRPSFLSPALLADLYPWPGSPDDFAGAPSLSPEARRIAEILLVSGPTSTVILRTELGAEGRRGQARFSRALAELGRTLLVTHYGVEEQESGWPATVLELTARAFDLSSEGARSQAGRDPAGGARSQAGRDPAGGARSRARATERFLRTMVAARPAELAGAFGWSGEEAQASLEALLRSGRARVDGALFWAAP